MSLLAHTNRAIIHPSFPKGFIFQELHTTLSWINLELWASGMVGSCMSTFSTDMNTFSTDMNKANGMVVDSSQLKQTYTNQNILMSYEMHYVQLMLIS